MLWFLNREGPKGQIMDEEWVALGKKHNLPTMIDIAADVPPVENLWKFNDMGFDLVAISGGKKEEVWSDPTLVEALFR